MKKVVSLMSLCMKAGKMVTGETLAENVLRDGSAELVIIAGDASENTKSKFINKSFYYKKPALVFGDRQTLSKGVGKSNRAVFVVTEPHFAKRLMEIAVSIENNRRIKLETPQNPGVSNLDERIVFRNSGLMEVPCAEQ